MKRSHLNARTRRPFRTAGRGWQLAASVAFAAVLSTFVRAANAPAPTLASGDEILHYLDRSIQWYRRVAALDQMPADPQEVLFRQTIHQNAKRTLQLSFDYARAAAELAPASGNGAASAPSARTQNLNRAAEAAAKRISDIQASLAKLNQQIESSSAASRPDFEAQRDKLQAELNFARARQDIIQNLAGFASDTGPSTLQQQIDQLQGSVPELQDQTQGNDAASNSNAVKPTNGTAATASAAAAAAASAATQQQTFHAESAGIIGLVSEMFTISGRMNEMKHLADDTDQLRKANDALRAPIRTELLNTIHRGDALATTAPATRSLATGTGNADAAAAQGQELDALTARFRQLSAAGLPLNEQSIHLDAVKSNILQWRGGLSRQYSRIIRSLLVRLGAIVITIVVVLGISTIWRRATFRYVHDQRRRVQFLMIRRIVVSALLVIIVIAGVVTEIGSLATFAGLITAGIAVALQSVILSGAAYFFFMGRYGVRVGDRVTISGITGDVIETGLFRLYLMELAGTGRDLNATGRIVVFSNSVLFQAAPFYKQIPGTDYVWHEVALTLSPDSDYHLAERLLMEAVQSVYSQYSEEIEQQHRRAAGSLHFQMPAPKPQGRFRFVDAGLEFVVRYPVSIYHASEVSDRMTRKLLETIEHEPKLKLVNPSTPKIQPAA